MSAGISQKTGAKRDIPAEVRGYSAGKSQKTGVKRDIPAELKVGSAGKSQNMQQHARLTLNDDWSTTMCAMQTAT